MAYSPFFQVLHDERAPVGNLGRGTHYSVVRTLLPVVDNGDPSFVEEQMFLDARRRRLQVLDLAIIWDEDHDERIWIIIERLHAAGLLAPVRFIGERKGNVTLVCDPDMVYGDDSSGGGFERYCALIDDLSWAVDGDEWFHEVAPSIEDGCRQIIQAPKDRVDAYLKGIEASWVLGPKSWITKSSKPESRPIEFVYSK